MEPRYATANRPMKYDRPKPEVMGDDMPAPNCVASSINNAGANLSRAQEILDTIIQSVDPSPEKVINGKHAGCAGLLDNAGQVNTATHRLCDDLNRLASVLFGHSR